MENIQGDCIFAIKSLAEVGLCNCLREGVHSVHLN